MYKLRDVEKSYKKRGVSRCALKHVDLDLPNTGVFAVVGESGSGKSTLLNVLSCLVSPSKGSIQIEDTDASKFSVSERSGFAARKVGFSFQEDNLVSHATMLENMQTSPLFHPQPQKSLMFRLCNYKFFCQIFMTFFV